MSIEDYYYTLLSNFCRKLTANFLSKLKTQLQVNFCQHSCRVNRSPAQARLPQKSVKCLLFRLLFSPNTFLPLLERSWFLVTYFSFLEQIVLLVFPDYFWDVYHKFPIFFFIIIADVTSNMTSSLVFLTLL